MESAVSPEVAIEYDPLAVTLGLLGLVCMSRDDCFETVC